MHFKSPYIISLVTATKKISAYFVLLLSPLPSPSPSGGFQILGPWAIFYMRGPACERREQLGVWGRFLDFDPIQAILGPSGITLGHILQAAFEDGWVFF